MLEVAEQLECHCGGAHAHCDEAPPACLTELAAIPDGDDDAFDAALCAETLDTSTCSADDLLEVAEQLACHCGGGDSHDHDHDHDHAEEELPACLAEQVEAVMDGLLCGGALDTSTCSPDDLAELTEQQGEHCIDPVVETCGSPYDINDDGVVGVDDLLGLLASYGDHVTPCSGTGR
jgi:hypothetical protein